MSISDSQTIAELIAWHARQKPGAPALMAPGRPALSYGELSALAESACMRLRELGIAPEQRLGLIIPQRLELAAAQLTLSDAAILVPLDHAATDSELLSACTRARVDVLLTTPEVETAQRVALTMNLAVITLTPDPGGPAGCFDLNGSTGPAVKDAPGITGQAIARVQLTSGTTASPKLVPLSHALLLRRWRSHVSALELSTDDCCLCFRPLFLTGAIEGELGPTIAAGGSVVIASDFDGDRLYRYLDEYDITWYVGSPVYHEAILDRASRHADVIARVREEGRLRFIRNASYLLPPELAERLEETFGVACLDFMSSTESSLIARTPLSLEKRRTGTVGLPFVNEVVVANQQGCPVPTGEAGEILVRGPLVFDGYEGEDKLDAAVFKDGWYCTGDLGRFDADGYLSVVGRGKEVINRGGQKVSPEEVERSLCAHPGVREALCFAMPHKTLGEQTAAAVVMRDGQSLQVPVVRAFLAGRLAQYKIPRRIIEVDTLPRAASGKPVRKNAAVRLGLVAAVPASLQPDTAPTPTAELTHHTLAGSIAELWQEVLELPHPPGADDDFHELGGHSLHATLIATRLQELARCPVPLDLFWTYPRLADFVAALAETGLDDDSKTIWVEPASPPICPRDAAAPCPPSFIQQRLLFICAFEESMLPYQLRPSYRITGRLDVPVLRRALNTILQRHEVLRASFPGALGQWQQQFATESMLELPLTDLGHLPAEAGLSRARHLAIEESSVPVDLAQGPLLRCRLLRLAEDDHVLIMTLHHLLYDGRSTTLLYRELGLLYQAYSAGQPSPLAPLQLQYGDYASWQRRYLDGARLDRLLDYWSGQLDAAPMVLELPGKCPLGTAHERRALRQWFRLPDALAAKLRSLCVGREVSLFMLLLAAFGTLLSRYSGREDFILGTAVDNRTSATRDLIGLFLETLPLRLRFEGISRFDEHLDRVRDTVLEALRHKELPFELLVRRLNPPRPPGVPPLVQVMFAMMPPELRVMELPGLRVERMPLDQGIANLDLTMVMAEDRGGLEGFIEYDAGRFTKQAIGRLLRGFEALLEAVVEDPAYPLALLPVQAEDDARRVLVMSQGSERPYPDHSSIPALFSDIARNRPDALALVDGETRLSYRALDSAANAAAHELIEQGIGADTPVGLCVDRGYALVVGMLAIVKAGGVYVPLDPGYPQPRLEFMLADAGTSVLVTQRHLRDRFSEFPGSVIELGGWKGHSTSDPGMRGGKLACLLYTSGSTGIPNGAELTHKGILNLVRGTELCDFDAEPVMLQVSSFSFDAATLEIWGALLNGGSLVLVENALDVAQLRSLIHLHGANAAVFPTSLFQHIVEQGSDSLQGLRRLIVGGEALSPDHARVALETCPELKLINGYGPTECTTAVCAYRVPIDPPDDTVPIGRPLANMRVFILDRDLQLQPLGVPGELYIAGPGLARGYRNRPELNVERFRHVQLDGRDERIYRTGDLARWRDDGYLEYLGRVDEQLKIRGFRIEPGEVEAALIAIPGVSEALVVARQIAPGDRRLVAYLILDQHRPARVAALREQLGTQLPAHMVPSIFVPLADFPRLPNGKLDRGSLPLPGLNHRDIASEYAAPRDAVEQSLAEMWQEVLKQDSPPGVFDNFFELGGDSLTSIRVINRIEEAFGTRISLARFFQDPTIAALAKMIFADTSGESPDKITPVTR